ncbi:MAG: phosphoadenosine phosphosulfate reductase family protein [Pseudomonadota bacterium]
MKEVKHLLGLSGGKDSAALAVYMRQHHPKLEIEYFYTDTGKELPEVYEFLSRLEGFLGKRIKRLNPGRDFDYWLKEYNNFLPSAQTRWCTRALKLEPFNHWAKQLVEQGFQVKSYVAIRADEPARSGFISKDKDIEVVLPLKDAGIDRAEVIRLLDSSGLGLPKYYDWRSRSGCTFCFFQQKIEWVHLKERHPQAFEEAKMYEQQAIDSGSPFSWSQGEYLEELEVPERMEQIRANHEAKLTRLKAKKKRNPLWPDDVEDHVDIDELYGSSEEESSCVICHK